MLHARDHWRRFDAQALVRARSRASASDGTRMPAISAIIPITTSNSRSENAAADKRRLRGFPASPNKACSPVRYIRRYITLPTARSKPVFRSEFQLQLYPRNDLLGVRDLQRRRVRIRRLRRIIDVRKDLRVVAEQVIICT